jgi:hypothetical protein
MSPDRPPISAADVRALLWLIAFFAIVVAICAVDPTQMAGPR